MSNRLLYIDKMKALAIMLVVMGHTIYFSMYHEESPNDYVFNTIYSFHVPLFFFLSGVVITRLPGIRKCCSKARRFLLPMLIVGFVNAILIGRIKDFFTDSGHNGYWYLLTLTVFYMMLLPFHLNKERRPLYGFLLDGTIALMVWVIFYVLMKCPHPLFNSLNCWGAFVNWPYFIIGYLVRKYHVLHLMADSWGVTFSSAAVYLLLLVFLFSDINYLPIHLEMLIALSAITALTGMFSRTENTETWVDRQLIFIGGHTLDIYIYHYFFIRFVSIDFVKTYHPVQEIVFITLLTLVIVYASLGIGMVITEVVNKAHTRKLLLSVLALITLLGVHPAF